MMTDKSQLVVTIDIDGFQSEEISINCLDDIDEKMQKFFEAYNISNPFFRMKLKSRILTAFKTSQKRPSVNEAPKPSTEERHQTISQLAQLKKIVAMTGSNFFKQNNVISAAPMPTSKKNSKRSPETKEGSMHISSSQSKPFNKHLIVPNMSGRLNTERKRLDSKQSRSSKASYDLQSATSRMTRIPIVCRLIDQRGCTTSTNIENKRENRFEEIYKNSFFNFNCGKSRSQSPKDVNSKATPSDETMKNLHNQRTRLPSANMQIPNVQSPNVQSPDFQEKLQLGSSGSFQTKKNSNMKNPLWTYNISTSPNTSEVQHKYHIVSQLPLDNNTLQDDIARTRNLSQRKNKRYDTEMTAAKERELLSNPASERRIIVHNERPDGESEAQNNFRQLFDMLDEKQLGFICQKNLSFKRLSVDQLKYLEPIFLEVFTRDSHKQYDFADFVQMCKRLC